MNTLLAVRAATRGAEAAQDAAARIARGEHDEARSTIEEAKRHLDRAAGLLQSAEDGAR